MANISDISNSPEAADGNQVLQHFLATNKTSAGCLNPLAIPIVLQNAASWNTTGCLSGFLCPCIMCYLRMVLSNKSIKVKIIPPPTPLSTVHQPFGVEQKDLPRRHAPSLKATLSLLYVLLATTVPPGEKNRLNALPGRFVIWEVSSQRHVLPVHIVRRGVNDNFKLRLS